MIKSSSIFFIYTPQPEFRNAKRPVWDYPPQILSTQIYFCVSELIPCSRIIRVYLHSLGAHIICVPASFVIRNASLSLVSSEVVAGVSVCFACQ